MGKSLVFVLLALTATEVAQGAAIVFDDLTDTITATLDGAAANCPFGVEAGLGGFCTIVLQNFLANPATVNQSFVYTLDEPGNSDQFNPPSDTIIFGLITGSRNLSVEFDSDPAAHAQTSYGHTAETGDFQPIPLPGGLPPLADNNTLTVSARSDLGGTSDVPEPGVFALVCASLTVYAAYDLARRVLARFRSGKFCIIDDSRNEI
jgi:hypothetical protein